MRYAFYPNDTHAHAEKLAKGLEKLGSQFIAEICGVCGGKGEYQQTYTAGCGGGYFRSTGDCDYCKRMGLLINGEPAPESVVHQVLNAAGG